MVRGGGGGGGVFSIVCLKGFSCIQVVVPDSRADASKRPRAAQKRDAKPDIASNDSVLQS